MKNILMISVLILAPLLGHTSQNFTVMTYNVENLFDNVHDKGKNDWTWLSLETKENTPEALKYCRSIEQSHYRRECFELDWNDEILNKKLKSLSEVILTPKNTRVPDVIVFEEVENKRILKILVGKYLAKAGFKYISLLEGADSRGIDIGVVSRFPIKSEKIHQINLAPHSSRTTRPILETVLNVYGREITVFGNHWPSQGNVDATRLKASSILKQKALASKSDLVLAVGDFNTLPDDKPHGININILPIFEDVEVKARQINKDLAPGTHWYRGHWDSLDKIFVLKRKNSKGIFTEYSSFEILNHSFMLRDLTWTDFDTGTTYTDKNIPHRFNKITGEGFSDHLPVSINFKIY